MTKRERYSIEIFKTLIAKAPNEGLTRREVDGLALDAVTLADALRSALFESGTAQDLQESRETS